MCLAAYFAYCRRSRSFVRNLKLHGGDRHRGRQRQLLPQKVRCFDKERGAVGAQIVVGGRHLEITALKNISLSLKDGDRVCFVGINGSSKSTLLKLCAGALAAQTGKMRIERRVSPRFALGSGMKPALTGRQNTELKCLCMSVTQSAIAANVEEVKALSGLLRIAPSKLFGWDALAPSDELAAAGSRRDSDYGRMGQRRRSVSECITRQYSRATDQEGEDPAGMLAGHSRRVLEEWVEKLA